MNNTLKTHFIERPVMSSGTVLHTSKRYRLKTWPGIAAHLHSRNDLRSGSRTHLVEMRYDNALNMLIEARWITVENGKAPLIEKDGALEAAAAFESGQKTNRSAFTQGVKMVTLDSGVANEPRKAYAVYCPTDWTEGRTPPKLYAIRKTEEEAWRITDGKEGVFGSKFNWRERRFGDWHVRPIEAPNGKAFPVCDSEPTEAEKKLADYILSGSVVSIEAVEAALAVRARYNEI